MSFSSKHSPKKFRQGVSTYFDDYRSYNLTPAESSYVSPYSQRLMSRPRPHRDSAYAWAVGPGYTEPYDNKPRDPYYQKHRDSQAFARASVQPGMSRNRPSTAPVKRRVPSYATGSHNLSAYTGEKPLPYYRYATPYPPSQRPPVVYSYVTW